MNIFQIWEPSVDDVNIGQLPLITSLAAMESESAEKPLVYHKGNLQAVCSHSFILRVIKMLVFKEAFESNCFLLFMGERKSRFFSCKLPGLGKLEMMHYPNTRRTEEAPSRGLGGGLGWGGCFRNLGRTHAHSKKRKMYNGYLASVRHSEKHKIDDSTSIFHGEEETSG